MMANWQIKINWGKTKEMVVKRGGGSCNVSVKGGRIEEVKVMNFYNHNIYIYIYIYTCHHPTRMLLSVVFSYSADENLRGRNILNKNYSCYVTMLESWHTRPLIHSVYTHTLCKLLHSASGIQYSGL